MSDVTIDLSRWTDRPWYFDETGNGRYCDDHSPVAAWPDGNAVEVPPLDRRSWSTVWWRGNADFLALLALFVAACLVCSCSSTGSTIADRVIENQSPGFFQRAWDFLADIGFPVVIGVGIGLLFGGDPISLLMGTGGASATARAMRPDPKPANITIIEPHVADGARLSIDAKGLAVDPGTVPAISEGLMQQTIEHYGFWILLAAFAWRNRRHLGDIVFGRARGRTGRTLWHCLWGGDDPSTEAVEKE